MIKKDYKYMVLEFVEKINERDIDSIYELMSDDFVFNDSIGGTINGKENMRKAWEDYFTMFPDYEINISHILQQERTVALLGTASGTYAINGAMHKENNWRVSAAWKAVVGDHTIREWYVYADFEPVRKIIEKHSM